LDGVIDRDTYVAEKAKGMSQKKSLGGKAPRFWGAKKFGTNRSKIGF